MVLKDLLCAKYTGMTGPLSESTWHNQLPYGRLAGLSSAQLAPLGEIEESIFFQGCAAWHQAVQLSEQVKAGFCTHSLPW